MVLLVSFPEASYNLLTIGKPLDVRVMGYLMPSQTYVSPLVDAILDGIRAHPPELELFRPLGCAFEPSHFHCFPVQVQLHI